MQYCKRKKRNIPDEPKGYDHDKKNKRPVYFVPGAGKPAGKKMYDANAHYGQQYEQ